MKYRLVIIFIGFLLISSAAQAARIVVPENSPYIKALLQVVFPVRENMPDETFEDALRMYTKADSVLFEPYIDPQNSTPGVQKVSVILRYPNWVNNMVQKIKQFPDYCSSSDQVCQKEAAAEINVRVAIVFLVFTVDSQSGNARLDSAESDFIWADGYGAQETYSIEQGRLVLSQIFTNETVWDGLNSKVALNLFRRFIPGSHKYSPDVINQIEFLANKN